jgi:nitrite transporter NirC
VPISIPEALSSHEELAAAKAAQAKGSMGKYLLSSALAGAYVGVAVLLLIMTSASLVAANHPMAKLVQGAVFGVALTLVVFAGAELFTGNNMIMLQGWLKKRVSAVDVALVWVASLIGNLIGAVAFAKLVDGAGVITVGTKPGAPSAPLALLTSIASSKAALTGGQLFLRSLLCNLLVCLALWMAARAASDAAKLIVLWWALLAFIASGFEHSIANMTSLSLAAMSGVGQWSELWRNLTYTVPGNIVGGGLFIGLAYGWLGRPATIPTAVATATVTAWVDEAEEDVAPVAPVAPAKKAPARKPPARKAPAGKAVGTNGSGG